MNISEGFGELGITITHQQILQVERFVISFLLRKTHPLTFDGIELGVNPVAFTTSDYNTLFDIFHIHPKDIESKIAKISSINPSFNVTSDPFNLLCFWLCHLAPIYIKDKRVAHNFMTNVLRLFHYKIFCSAVNNSFRHGANKGIMAATIGSMTLKSDIIRLESWKLLIDSHIEKILDPKDKVYQTIVDVSPDEEFLSTIAKQQTALRSKIVTFAQAYYDTHAAGDSIGSISAISTNADGEKIIAQTASVIDSATSSMVSEILNPNMFVNEVSVKDISNMFSNVSASMLRTALLRINTEAVLQTSSRTFDKVVVKKDVTIYVGIRALVMEIISSTVRMCRTKKINMGNKGLVFKTMRDVYSSSRSLDKDVLNIKQSIGHLVDPFNITINAPSQAALRLAVIYYIVYRTILKMKL